MHEEGAECRRRNAVRQRLQRAQQNEEEGPEGLQRSPERQHRQDQNEDQRVPDAAMNRYRQRRNAAPTLGIALRDSAAIVSYQESLISLLEL
ncbi:unnamed protein product [Cylicostephanus goldi]|uniref:Uncharacterized protein n=1 Tax=Cylicostephanus goldi TaxID=71465 RepID=A0A3P7N396_CYLGO|nr:unnamed protein product [Cylicostephanus goldi]